jgi:hypothetical protein
MKALNELSMIDQLIYEGEHRVVEQVRRIEQTLQSGPTGDLSQQVLASFLDSLEGLRRLREIIRDEVETERP